MSIPICFGAHALLNRRGFHFRYQANCILKKQEIQYLSKKPDGF